MAFSSLDFLLPPSRCLSDSRTHKMPFNNLTWLSDIRNVWTSEIIFDFKIFQSFLFCFLLRLALVSESSEKHFDFHFGTLRAHIAITQQSGCKSLISGKRLNDERGKLNFGARDEKCAMKDRAETFIGEFN